MIVKEVISACEYAGCDVFTQLGKKIEITNENFLEVYNMSVEHLSAKDNIVQIWTFKDLDKLGEV